MQIIKREKPNVHPLFDEFDKIYAEFSSRKQAPRLTGPVFDSSLQPVIDIFQQYGWEGKVSVRDKGYPQIGKATRQKSIIVCFSGGKDSIATVLYYKKMGYKIYLYHLSKINPPLYDEKFQAQKLADYWGLPLFVDSITLSGMHDYVEHPMKNMIIANGALQYAIRQNLPLNIAFGNYTTSSLQYDNFEFCGGDDKEMWEVYDKVVGRYIPGFHMNVILGNINDTLETVCPDKELMELSVSCLGRASMRKYWHDWVLSKFGVNLPSHRCGRCYKCCMEYIYMADHGLQTYSAEYYRYCLNNLRKNVEREDGVRYSEEEVWNHYFFYSKEESKYFSLCATA